jgi:TPR repeat protein
VRKNVFIFIVLAFFHTSANSSEVSPQKTKGLIGLGMVVMFETGEKQKVALEKIEKFAKEGKGDAAYMLSDFYEKGVGVELNEDKSIHWLKRSAQLSDKNGMGKLGVYLWTNGKKEEGVLWITKSAKANNDTAQLFLARAYLSGSGIEKSDEKAKYWLEKSVENGNYWAPKLLDRLNKKNSKLTPSEREKHTSESVKKQNEEITETFQETISDDEEIFE